MLKLTRRSFIAGTAAVPFWFWFEKYAGAQPSPGLVRCEATTPQGQAMLLKYAQGVAKMTASPSSDPRSWLFQWYTHFVSGATTKDDEIARIFAGNGGTGASLAGEMWNTCQAHSDNQDENYFLPWHRMFVYFFERIVRSAVNDPTFALPYWNYSTADPTTHGVIPGQFRMQTSSAFGALFRSNRNSGVNQGQPIDQDQPADLLGLSVLGEGSYGPNGAQGGFCQDLDQGLHGAVHVQVGDVTGMGQIPFAANDPIFWMHHCNIDRVWASWQANGGLNPGGSWGNQPFIFVDENGTRVAATVGEFTEIAKLGYSYDRLEPAPPGFRPLTHNAIGIRPTVLLAKIAGPIILGAAPVSAHLESAKPGVSFQFPNQPRSLLAGKKMYLMLRGLRTDVQPGVMYHVYLDLPQGTVPKKGDPHHVGVLNFFGTPHHHSEASASPAPSNLTSRFVSIDVTSIAQSLAAQNALTQTPSVSIVPWGKPTQAAKPVIGEITLVQQ